MTDIRMGLAATELKKPAMTTEAVVDLIGYRSEAAFRRRQDQDDARQWRRLAREGLLIAHPAVRRGLQARAA
ncbi:hypothetical protein [Mesorhizobium hawassense]|uniref:hypothetical protein n=1 Tax=Mesorhizobium hawassense TaxID=1209954 RepID=UPI001ABF7491